MNVDIQIVREDDYSEILVATPLLPGHKISRETKVTIKRNELPFTWITCTGEYNIPTNWWYGSRKYFQMRSTLKIPYILPLDKDIKLGRHMLDRLLAVIKQSSERHAFCYCSFEFKGAINRQFPCEPYDINRLIKGNYISSNSLIKYDYLEFIGGPVMEQKYKRLLDWALWLKFFQYGYIGIPCPEAFFTAYASEDSISAGTAQDYQIKARRVWEDFGRPIVLQAQAEIDAAKDLATASMEIQEEEEEGVISMFDED